MKLLFINKVGENREAFAKKVIEISEKLDINPDWLMAVMNSESGLNHRIQNTSYPVNGGFATGLIQFIPSTAKGLGTTTEELKNMSNVEQLDYVFKYFKPYADKIENFVDLYMVTFFPAAVGKPGNHVLRAKNIPAGAVAKSNPIFDLDKNGSITVAEVEEAFLKRLPASLREAWKKKRPIGLKGSEDISGKS